MALALTDIQGELADAVKDFVAKRVDLSTTRSRSDELCAGHQNELWQEVVAQGLHSLHLPEEVGGMGGAVTDLTVAVSTAAEGLLPGAYVPTVFASAVAHAAGAPAPLLERFAEGATAAVVTGEFSVDPSGALSGKCEPALGVLAAEVLIVVIGKPTAGQREVFAVDSAAAVREATVGVDLTRDTGTIELQSASAERLGSISAGSYLALCGSIYGAEAAGLSRAALGIAVEYAKTRQQFGVPIGAFQATKHKAGRMMVAAELAASAAWGAAQSLTQNESQQRIAGATADLVALKQAPKIITDAVTILGGIGFTWEHDIHLFLRRAISVSGLNGSRGTVVSSLGEISVENRREAEVELPDEDAAFRQSVADLLDHAANLPVDTPRFEGEGGRAYGRGPRRTFLAENGLVAPHWPKPWGLAASPTEQIVIAQEFARRSITPPTTVIGEWAMPTILAHGTDAQKEKLGIATLAGDIVWCQLFSEPEAGSDLASLRTKAIKVDGGWRLDGQKVWNSSAQDADWGICLARTDSDAPKHKGITFFLIDMTTPGLTVRPLKQSTGESEFSEVFLDEVFVPDDMVVGNPGEGWRITLTTLQNERTSIGSSLSVGVEDGIRAAIAHDAFDDRREAISALGEVTALSTAIGSLNLAETLRRLNGLEPGAGSSLAKVATAEAARIAADIALGVGGARTLLENSPGEPVYQQLALPQQLIGGGTVEIQLNVIAERILGLPRG